MIRILKLLGIVLASVLLVGILLLALASRHDHDAVVLKTPKHKTVIVRECECS